MKVEGSGGMRGGTPVRRSGKSEGTGKSGFAKQLAAEEEGAAAASGVSGPATIGGVFGVLALQEVDDAAARASRGKMRAQEMLDRLDEIRLALLSGDLSVDRVAELARSVQSRRAQVDDPRLAEILDEIDLRAQVELAKLMAERG